MKYETSEWQQPNTILEAIDYLKTLPCDTKIRFDLRLLVVIDDNKTVKNELQYREREIGEN